MEYCIEVLKSKLKIDELEMSSEFKIIELDRFKNLYTE